MEIYKFIMGRSFQIRQVNSFDEHHVTPSSPIALPSENSFKHQAELTVDGSFGDSVSFKGAELRTELRAELRAIMQKATLILIKMPSPI